MTAEYSNYLAFDTLRDDRKAWIRAIRPEDKDLLQLGMQHLSPESLYFRFFSHKENLSPKELAYFTEIDFVHHVALLGGFYDNGEMSPAGTARYIMQTPTVSPEERFMSEPSVEISPTSGPATQADNSSITASSMPASSIPATSPPASSPPAFQLSTPYTPTLKAPTAQSDLAQSGTSAELCVAELAVTVAEEYQGLGFATILLRHLISIARANGVTEFTGTVLPNNKKMLNLITRSGLPARRTLNSSGEWEISLLLT